MRIVHFIEYMDPTQGGPPSIVARVAAAQARLGHDVTLLTSAESMESSAAIERVFSPLQRFNWVRRRSVQAPFIPSRFFWPAYNRMAAVLNGAHVVHVHAVWDPMLIQGMRHCRHKRIPMCVTPHGMLTRNNVRRRWWKKKLALSLGWGSAINGAGFLHCLTDEEGSDARTLGLTPRVVVLPNAVDTQELAVPVDAQAIAAALPPHASSRFILSLGRLHETKGLDILCDAFAVVAAAQPDVDLVIAGPDFGYETKLRRQIAALGLEKRIHIVGSVYGAAKVALLRSAVCLCHSSRQEGFSMAILEALACGTPAVISTECHFAELETENAGFVVPLDPQAFAKALLVFLLDDSARRKAADAAVRLIQERYTVDRLAARLVENYLTLSGDAR